MNSTRTLKLLSIAATIAALSAFPGRSFAETAKLDGSVYAGKLWMQGEKKPEADTFIFKDGTFRSTACDKYGFTAVAYRAMQDGDATLIEAETQSPSDGRMVWRGTVRAGQFEGVNTWHPKRGSATEGWFRAEIRK